MPLPEPDRDSEIAGAIWQALMEADAPFGEQSVHLDLATCPACAGIDPDDLARVLASQDPDILGAVAGRPVSRLAQKPTAVAI